MAASIVERGTMQPFVMSVNNAGAGHSAKWWPDEPPTLRAIYFDGDEWPHVAPVEHGSCWNIVRRDAPSAVRRDRRDHGRADSPLVRSVGHGGADTNGPDVRRRQPRPVTSGA